jgi:hypothetical protein
VTAKILLTLPFSANADTTVPVQNSGWFYVAMRKAKVQAAMHFLPTAEQIGML